MNNKTIMNNDIDETFYTLSIRELAEMCRDYVLDQESDTPSNSISHVECYVDYIVRHRKDINK